MANQVHFTAATVGQAEGQGRDDHDQVGADEAPDHGRPAHAGMHRRAREPDEQERRGERPVDVAREVELRARRPPRRDRPGRAMLPCPVAMAK